MVVGMQHTTLVSCPQQVEVFLDWINLFDHFSITSFIITSFIIFFGVCLVVRITRKQIR